MECFSLSVHSDTENSGTVAQTSKKGRSREEKIGRLRYNQFLLKRLLTEVEDIREIQRVILNGLKSAGYFHFDVSAIQKLACQDQLDVEILGIVHDAGRAGILPKDIASKLPEYKDLKGQPIKHFHVTRRIDRMNRRLQHETGEVLFEKRGWRWALTLFGLDLYGDVDRRSLEEFNVESKESANEMNLNGT